MIGPGAGAKVIVATRPVDFRKGPHALAALVGAEYGDDPPLMAYAYAPDHKSERAEAHLGSDSGILQVDGYSGYAALARRSQQLSLAFCWSHVRRKFYKLADSSPVATDVLRRIAMLYAIENEVWDTSAEQRRAAHAEQARVIVDDLHVYLEARLRQVSADSKLADVIR